MIFLYAGVTTIAGGKWGRAGGHVDGPSEDAKFSNDFDIIYVGSSCSLLVIDRGNQAIREIQLNHDDCSYQYDGSFHLGIIKQSEQSIHTCFHGHGILYLMCSLYLCRNSSPDCCWILWLYVGIASA